jgi:hypothetical protein
VLPDWLNFVSTIVWLKTSELLSNGEETARERARVRWRTRTVCGWGGEENKEIEGVEPGSCAQSIDSELYPENDGHKGHGQPFETAKRE